MYEEFKRQLNRVAETQYYLRPQLIGALKSQILTEPAKKIIGNHTSYADYWTASLSDKFFDMATMNRLGTSIEGCLKWYYMMKKGYANNVQLRADPHWKKNIFQRVQTWQPDGVLSLYGNQLAFDLTTIKELAAIQEMMMHRHLYTHSSGLLDDEYLKRIKQITGQDILVMHPEIAKSYPNQDTYWFEPLDRLAQFIELARKFFGQFP
jgi:hypothetical protein